MNQIVKLVNNFTPIVVLLHCNPAPDEKIQPTPNKKEELYASTFKVT
jgi:hypothetical protein